MLHDRVPPGRGVAEGCEGGMHPMPQVPRAHHRRESTRHPGRATDPAPGSTPDRATDPAPGTTPDRAADPAHGPTPDRSPGFAAGRTAVGVLRRATARASGRATDRASDPAHGPTPGRAPDRSSGCASGRHRNGLSPDPPGGAGRDDLACPAGSPCRRGRPFRDDPVRSRGRC